MQGERDPEQQQTRVDRHPMHFFPVRASPGRIARKRIQSGERKSASEAAAKEDGSTLAQSGGKQAPSHVHNTWNEITL